MRPVCLIVLSLAACTGLQPTTIYAGPQRPIAGACNPAGRATLTRRGNTIVLAPAEGTLTLPGTLQGETIAAQATLQGMNHLPYALSFAGRLDGQTISGTLTTPRCRYDLRLQLTGD